MTREISAKPGARLPGGARARTVSYSIVETAKENGLDPLLLYLFERLTNTDIKDTSAIKELLTWEERIQGTCKAKSTLKRTS